MNSEALAAVIARIRKVPDELRTFTEDARMARLLYGTNQETLAALEEHGLPRRQDGDRTLYDAHDLTNASLYLGLPSVQRQTMKSWLDSLELADSAGVPPTFQVKYAIPLAPGADPPRNLTVLLPDGGAEVVATPSGNMAKVLDWTLRHDWPAPPDDLRSILRDLAGMEFFMLPPALRQDTSFAVETGLLDCGLASRVAITRAAAAGFQARLRYGLLLGAPASTVHAWPEVLIEGTWTPFDPLILGTLTRHLGLDPRRWPPDRSPGAVLLPLADEPRDIVTSEGQAIPATFVTALAA